MKALSLRQPWAWLIAKGIKDVENRTWRTTFRGRFYIHASKSRADIEGPIVKTLALRLNDAVLGHTLLGMATDSFTLGAIIGEATIIDCKFRFGEENDSLYSKWSEAGLYGFVLANAVLYEKPVPCRGALGFFEPDIERVEE